MKTALSAAARRANMTTSDLLRGLSGQIVEGRSADGRVRADMAAVRTLANRLLAWADRASCDEERDLGLIVRLANQLHEMAARHLGPPS
ncbi:MAG: hypothetical protein ACRYGP_29565 [Janthinobacterium lividum]